jgi:hypothetical protein
MLELIQDLGQLFPTEKSKRKFRFGLYKCHCGNEFKTQTAGVTSGNTKSCGCNIATKNGITVHRLYGTWAMMIQRTSNPKNVAYKNYGGRGIKVCDRWTDASLFIEDMYPTFAEGLSLDRIDNDKGYSQENCRWTTSQIQGSNSRVIRESNKSGYRGVYFHKQSKKWRATIVINYKSKHLGTFENKEDARDAYDKYVIENNLEHNTNKGR